MSTILSDYNSRDSIASNVARVKVYSDLNLSLIINPFTNDLSPLTDIDAVAGYSRIAFCSADNAAGGMLGTAKENVLFWNRLMTGKIINQASLAQLQGFIPAPDQNNLYGLGIIKTVNAFNKRTILSHNGYVPGSINDNAYDPISGVCISVLTNQDQLRDLTPILAALHKVTL